MRAHPLLLQLEDLDTLKSCLGWQLESAAEDVVSSKVSARCFSRLQAGFCNHST